MDQGKIVDLVMGLISALIIGGMVFLFTSIADLKHNQDIMGVQVKQNRSELDDIWLKYNERDRNEKAEMNQEFEFALKLIQDNTRVELMVKELEIKFLENNSR